MIIIVLVDSSYMFQVQGDCITQQFTSKMSACACGERTGFGLKRTVFHSLCNILSSQTSIDHMVSQTHFNVQIVVQNAEYILIAQFCFDFQ